MKITVRGESVKMDPNARGLIIQALNSAAEGWLNDAADETNAQERASLLDQAGEVKAFAKLLEPKDDTADA